MTPTRVYVDAKLWGGVLHCDNRRCDHGNGCGEHLRRIRPNEADTARAERIVTWLEQAVNVPSPNDYIFNLQAVSKAKLVPMRRSGFVCSVYGWHSRETEAKLRVARAPSEWVGSVKERLVFDATIEHTHSMDSDYGTTTIVRFRSGDNTLVWFASGCPEWAEVGWSGKIKATIKKHDTRKDEKQTVITRVVEAT